MFEFVLGNVLVRLLLVGDHVRCPAPDADRPRKYCREPVRRALWHRSAECARDGVTAQHQDHAESEKRGEQHPSRGERRNCPCGWYRRGHEDRGVDHADRRLHRKRFLEKFCDAPRTGRS